MLPVGDRCYHAVSNDVDSRLFGLLPPLLRDGNTRFANVIIFSIRWEADNKLRESKLL